MANVRKQVKRQSNVGRAGTDRKEAQLVGIVSCSLTSCWPSHWSLWSTRVDSTVMCSIHVAYDDFGRGRKDKRVLESWKLQRTCKN